MQDKIEVINDNTVKAEKCLELDKQEFETAKRLWTQQLESLDRKLQELVKMTDTEFKSKEKYLKELNKLKEKHKDLEREVEKQKLEQEERKQAFDFLFNMSSDEFKENFEKNRQTRREITTNRQTLIDLLTWELNEYENTSVRIENLTTDEKERIKENIGQSSTFVTELEIDYINQENQDQIRKSKFEQKKAEIRDLITAEMNNESYISDGSEDIEFVETKDFQEKFDILRNKNMETLIENDEIIQKIEVYKVSNSNTEFNKNLNQLKKYVHALETDLKIKETDIDSIKDHGNIELDTETADQNQLEQLCKSLQIYMGGHSNYKLRTLDMLVFIQDKMNDHIKEYNNIDEDLRNDRHKKWENIKRKDKIEKNRIQQLEEKDIKKKDDIIVRTKHKTLMKMNLIHKDKKTEVKEMTKRREEFQDFIED